MGLRSIEVVNCEAFKTRSENLVLSFESLCPPRENPFLYQKFLFSGPSLFTLETDKEALYAYSLVLIISITT